MIEIDPSFFARIELLVLDVDGVLTDGRITLLPTGEEIKSFHVRDGAGMKYWRRVGKKLAIITGRGSPVVLHRARELDVDVVKLNALNKLPALEEVLVELGVSGEQTAVIGDDLPDLPLFRRCAFAVATADAVTELAAAAHHVTHLPGGAGCVRETIELILKRSGRWGDVLARYLPSERDSK